MPDETSVPPINWGGNIRYCAKRVHAPETVGEVARLVRESRKPKALGTRHSFNRIADTEGDLISMQRLNGVLHVDADKHTVTVEAGITYGALGSALYERGYAVENLPSLPHVCVGGAVQTATHGSGTANLSASVVAIQLVTADGSVLEVSRERDGDAFDGMVVSLGMLGIVTSLTLRIRPAFEIVQEVYEHVPLSDVIEQYEAIAAIAYSVSVFSDWQGDRVNQIWFKRVVSGREIGPLPFDFLAGRRAQGKRHPIAATPPDFCTEQDVVGPSHARLPHFRHDGEPSSAGEELQSEYFVHRRDLAGALEALATIGPQLRGCLMMSEIRNVGEDSLWLSPCHRGPAVALHFTWFPRQAEVLNLLETVLEPALRPFEPTPHWGKLFMLTPAEVQSRYAMMPSFRALCGRLDPGGKFRNGFAERYLFA